MPHGLTVLAAIRRGEEDALRQVLRGIGDDIKGKTLAARPRPHIDFPRSRRIHFARFAVLDDPDRGPARARLLFSTNYDGDLESHLAEVTSITSDMQAIWGSCEAYSGVESFPAFVRAHAHQPEAFYIAYREENVEQIQSRRGVGSKARPPWLADAFRCSSGSCVRCRSVATSPAPSSERASRMSTTARTGSSPV
jgi:hypothetical protein